MRLRYVYEWTLFQEIKAFVRLNFCSFRAMHCPRLCNKVANALALFGAKMDVDPQALWPGGAPTFVQDLVPSDYAVHFG